MQGARYLNTQGSENDPDHEAHVEIEECRQKRRKVADLEELSLDHAARGDINRRRPTQEEPPNPAWITQFPCHTLRPCLPKSIEPPSAASRRIMPADAIVDRLEIRVGLCTARGRRPQNEDYGGVYLGTAEQQARLGIIAAIADGVGGAKGGRVAAELAVRTFIDGYLSQSETRGVRQASARGLEAANRWIHAMGRSDPALQDMACTFTALVLRGRLAHIIHIGDTRLYRLRDDRLSLLTNDHTLSGTGRSHILTRAIGSAPAIPMDCATGEVRVK